MARRILQTSPDVPGVALNPVHLTNSEGKKMKNPSSSTAACMAFLKDFFARLEHRAEVRFREAQGRKAARRADREIRKLLIAHGQPVKARVTRP